MMFIIIKIYYPTYNEALLELDVANNEHRFYTQNTCSQKNPGC